MHHDKRRAKVHLTRARFVVRQESDVRRAVFQRADDARGVWRRHDSKRNRQAACHFLDEIRNGPDRGARLWIDTSVNGIAAEKHGPERAGWRKGR